MEEEMEENEQPKMEEKEQPDTPPSQDKGVGRRPMLTFLLGFSFFATIAGVLTPIIAYLMPPPSGSGGDGGRVLVGTTQDIPVGQSELVSVGNKPVIVAHTPHGPKAFSAICPHLGCICVWDQPRQVIVCPCHDGQFSPITGAVIAGPPPAPLAAIPASLEGDDIYVGEA